jgi:hypothetical protein
MNKNSPLQWSRKLITVTVNYNTVAKRSVICLTGLLTLYFEKAALLFATATSLASCGATATCVNCHEFCFCLS